MPIIVTTDHAKSFDVTQHVDGIAIETIISVSAIDHRREKPVFAVNENRPPWHAHEMRRCIKRIDRILGRLEQLYFSRRNFRECLRRCQSSH